MSNSGLRHRLAAILAADAAGYSRLMSGDELATVAALDAARAIFKSRIESSAGRVIDMAGDSILAIFETAAGAVAAAIAIQSDLGAAAADVPEGRRMRFRVGVHLGDIVEKDDGTIYGDGVNIAARLQTVAGPGSISVSEDVFRQVRDRIKEDFVDLGEQTFKNIARPVRAYSVGSTPIPAQRPALTLPDRPSIAVLPFDNMSGDAEQDYFADGMVEDIISGLSRIKWLFVIARNTSFAYKNRAVDIRQVGRELGVRYVLEGSVRRAGNRVRIAAQLIEAGTGAHIWAERYDRALDDVFALQDELTMSVVGAIEPNLRQAEIERVKRKRPDHLDAYDLVLRAMPFAYVAMDESAAQAIPLLERALQIEPEYALAHGLAAWCYEQRYIRGARNPEDRAAAITHAHAALTTGAQDATALALGGFVIALLEHDRKTAVDAIERALALSPSNAMALGFGAAVLSVTDQRERAVEWADRALRLSPFDPLRDRPLSALSRVYFATGRFAEAADAARRAIQANPNFSNNHLYLAAALVRQGQDAGAKAAVERVIALEPKFSIAGLYVLWGPTEFTELLAATCRQAGLPD